MFLKEILITPEQLSQLHESLSAAHRNAEKRVNYFKAKIKNLVTIENARISKENSIEQNRVNVINQKINEEYNSAYSKWSGEYTEAMHLFESARNEEIQEVAALKIEVPLLFKPTIDMFLNTIKQILVCCEPKYEQRFTHLNFSGSGFNYINIERRLDIYNRYM